MYDLLSMLLLLDVGYISSGAKSLFSQDVLQWLLYWLTFPLCLIISFSFKNCQVLCVLNSFKLCFSCLCKICYFSLAILTCSNEAVLVWLLLDIEVCILFSSFTAESKQDYASCKMCTWRWCIWDEIVKSDIRVS